MFLEQSFLIFYLLQRERGGVRERERTRGSERERDGDEMGEGGERD